MSLMGTYYQVTPEQLDRMLTEMETFHDFVENFDGDILDIYRTWHGLHFLLTGNPWHGDPPFSKIVLGGTPLITPEKEEFRVLYLRPEEVREVLGAILKIDQDVLWSNMDLRLFRYEGITPTYWWNDGNEQGVEELKMAFQDVLLFFQSAERKGNGIIFHLTE